MVRRRLIQFLSIGMLSGSLLMDPTIGGAVALTGEVQCSLTYAWDTAEQQYDAETAWEVAGCAPSIFDGEWKRLCWGCTYYCEGYTPPPDPQPVDWLCKGDGLDGGCYYLPEEEDCLDINHYPGGPHGWCEDFIMCEQPVIEPSQP